MEVRSQTTIMEVRPPSWKSEFIPPPWKRTCYFYFIFFRPSKHNMQQSAYEKNTCTLFNRCLLGSNCFSSPPCVLVTSREMWHELFQNSKSPLATFFCAPPCLPCFISSIFCPVFLQPVCMVGLMVSDILPTSPCAWQIGWVPGHNTHHHIAYTGQTKHTKPSINVNCNSLSCPLFSQACQTHTTCW